MDIYNYIPEIEQIAERSLIYEDIELYNNMIPLMLIGDNGIYIFINNSKTDIISLDKKIRLSIKYSGQSLFIFEFDYEKDECIFYNNYKNEKYIIQEEPVKAIERIYKNTQKPYTFLVRNGFVHDYDYFNEMSQTVDEYQSQNTGDPEYIKYLLSEADVNQIADALDNIMSKPTNECDYAERRDTSGIFFSGEKRKYKLSEMNSDIMYLKTVAGGWFGWHRFKEGDWLNGIFYALTCGIFGVGYISDLLLMLMGRRSYIDINIDVDSTGKKEYQKTKIYYAELENKKIALLGMAVAILITLIMANTAYKVIYNILIQTITAIAQMSQ